MKIGVTLPQYGVGVTEMAVRDHTQDQIVNDPIALRDYVQAAEDLGYTHFGAGVGEHVIGVNPASRPNWRGAYIYKHMFYEPIALTGYLAALTRNMELTIGAVILPQRQTALVAKQVAALDVLSGGRIRLDAVIGWNPVEYEALGQEFHNRGRRLEEQIAVLRALWTQELVTFEGQWHRIIDAGINPLPKQRQIPIRLGGGADRSLSRIGRLADGWVCPNIPHYDLSAGLARVLDSAREAGRDPANVGIEGSVVISGKSPDEWLTEVEAWHSLGATHLKISTLKSPTASPQDHIDAIRHFKETVGDL